MDRETITRRRLPHWYMPGAAHFVTYRLAGTLPRKVIEDLRQRRETLLKQRPPSGVTRTEHRARVHKMLFASHDNWLDNHREIDWLADPRLGSVVRSNLYHHDGGKYWLMAYCIMPNHVHVLLQPHPDALVKIGGEEAQHVGEREDSRSPLAKIMHSLKSYTAHEANRILGRSGTFWQKESYDHWVRDDDELEDTVNYIRGNPVAARLVEHPEDWLFSSCHDRFLVDRDTSGWLKT